VDDETRKGDESDESDVVMMMTTVACFLVSSGTRFLPLK